MFKSIVAVDIENVKKNYRDVGDVISNEYDGDENKYLASLPLVQYGEVRPYQNYILQDKFQDYISRQDYSVRKELDSLLYCGRSVISYTPAPAGICPSENYVEVFDNGKKAFFGGLVHCRSPWACPVDTPKILFKRSQEITKIIEWAYDKKGKRKDDRLCCIMITFTAEHHKDTNLKFLISCFKKALRRFKGGRSWQVLKKMIGFKHSISGYETTYSHQNGFHFHLHQLLFISQRKLRQLTIDFESDLRLRWLKCFEKEAGQVSNEAVFLKRGLVISRDKNGKVGLMHSGDYILGWSAENELTDGIGKSHKNGNIDIFDLLESDDEEDIGKFVEYALATKGKQRIIFSKGLKKVAGIDEKTDEEILEEEQEKSKLESFGVARWIRNDWNIIMEKSRKLSKFYRAYILLIAHNYGYEGLVNYCVAEGLPKPKPFLDVGDSLALEKSPPENIDLEQSKSLIADEDYNHNGLIEFMSRFAEIVEDGSVYDDGYSFEEVD